MKKLGFGLMRLPVKEDGAIDMEHFTKMVDRFMEEGFTYFDTAYPYHGGRSESAFGEAVAARYPRDAYTVTSKMPVFLIEKAEQYPTIFAEQLEKCKVDYFDYYFLHSLDGKSYEKVKEHRGFEFVNEKKKEGKIKHVGFSYHGNAEDLDRMLTEHPETELVQLQINYIDWDDAIIQSGKCYDVCMKHGVQVSIMEPLKGGSLATPPEKAAEILKAAAPELSVASWGIRFAASLDNVLVVLSGMSSIDQLEDNMSYMKDFKPLTDKEQATVKDVVKIINDAIAIKCTSCHYCTDGCPMNIAIPEYFGLYNSQHLYGMGENLKGNFRRLSNGRGLPSECIACGQCESHCPQHLPIIENMAKVAEIFG